jgi:hypothetical protein
MARQTVAIPGSIFACKSGLASAGNTASLAELASLFARRLRVESRPQRDWIEIVEKVGQ